MNLMITRFQTRLMLRLRGKELTTYELSRELRQDFWRVQTACQTLYSKAYLNNYDGKWKWREKRVPAPKNSSSDLSVRIYSGSTGGR